MATIPAAGYISNSARTVAQMKTALDDVVASLRQVPGAGQAELTNTITSGSITPAGSGGVVVIDTEASAATDDLTNIVTTNYPDGSFLLIRNSNAARFVVVKHTAGGAGQISLDRGVDYTLDDTKKWLLLQRRGADWQEILRGPTRVAMPTVTKTASFTPQKEDLGKVMLCSNAISVTLLAATTMGSGYVVSLRNIGVDTVTVDANGSELIDGQLTLAIPAGATAVLICDGIGWTAMLIPVNDVAKVNPIINGSMEIWQRGTAFTNPAANRVTADRWVQDRVGAVVYNVNRSTNVPTVSQAGVLFNYSLEIDITTADASIAAGDYAFLGHRLEGYNWRQFAQRQFTLSFWVMGSKTGTHCVGFRNNAGATPDRSYIGTYSISVANTWEYKTITVLPSPSAGTWNYTNGGGLEIAFTLAVGSTFQTTAGAWNTGNFLGTSAQVNELDSTANFFRITGVKMELGAIATPLAHVDFQAELDRCKRYYQKSFPYPITPAQGAGMEGSLGTQASSGGAASAYGWVDLPVALMDYTTVNYTTYNPGTFTAQARNDTRAADCTSTNFGNISDNGFLISSVTPVSTVAGDAIFVNWTIESEIL